MKKRASNLNILLLQQRPSIAPAGNCPATQPAQRRSAQCRYPGGDSQPRTGYSPTVPAAEPDRQTGAVLVGCHERRGAGAFGATLSSTSAGPAVLGRSASMTRLPTLSAPVIESDRVVLRKARDTDWKGIVEVMTDPEVRTYLGGPLLRDRLPAHAPYAVSSAVLISRRRWRRMLSCWHSATRTRCSAATSARSGATRSTGCGSPRSRNSYPAGAGPRSSRFFRRRCWPATAGWLRASTTRASGARPAARSQSGASPALSSTWRRRITAWEILHAADIDPAPRRAGPTSAAVPARPARPTILALRDRPPSGHHATERTVSPGVPSSTAPAGCTSAASLRTS